MIADGTDMRKPRKYAASTGIFPGEMWDVGIRSRALRHEPMIWLLYEVSLMP